MAHSPGETHLALNAVVYVALTLWEHQHVVHHLAEMRRPMPEQPAMPLAA